MTSTYTTTPDSAEPARRDGETKGTALAPSQHNRRTLGEARSRRRFPPVFLALLLGATLGLSACGTQEASSAAIVNGTSISERDVQSVSDQVNTFSQGGQKLAASDALLSLILAPYVLDEAKRAHKTISESEARRVIAKIDHPSAATITFVQMQLAAQQLDQASKNVIVSELDKAKITVNPRYGSFDPKQIAMTPITPNWIKASASTPTK
ncbi:MAG: hypothetical protein ABI934_05095 [Actinomycetota bacterium]